MARTYIPTLIVLIKRLCKYVALYDILLRPYLPEGSVEQWDNFVEELNAICLTLTDANLPI